MPFLNYCAIVCGGLKAPVDFIVLCKVYTCMFSAYCIYLYVFCILYTLVCFLHIVYTCMFSAYCIHLYVFCILYILVCFLHIVYTCMFSAYCIYLYNVFCNYLHVGII